MNAVSKTPDVKTEENDKYIEKTSKVRYREIGNTTFEVVSHFSTKRKYEDIVKNALIREMSDMENNP